MKINHFMNSSALKHIKGRAFFWWLLGFVKLNHLTSVWSLGREQIYSWNDDSSGQMIYKLPLFLSPPFLREKRFTAVK